MPRATCNVLRCPEPAARAVRLSPPDGILLQGVVCADHGAAMDAGAPWRWEPDPSEVGAGSILMGEDLDAGSLIVTDFIGTEEHGLVLAPDGGPGTTFVFEQLMGDGSRRRLHLLMGEEVIDQLHETFKLWLRPERITDTEQSPPDAEPGPAAP